MLQQKKRTFRGGIQCFWKGDIAKNVENVFCFKY